MTLGERIKALRLEAGKTQEDLAEIFYVTPQTISRWETSSAKPDISQLVPLANYFNVSVDYLLGRDSYEADLQLQEYENAFFEYWKHDDKEKNYEMAKSAAEDYPANMEYKEWLASAEYFLAHKTEDDSEYRSLLESAEKHYKIVLNNTPTDSGLYHKALHGLVIALSFNQKMEEAKEYALLEENENERDELLCWCLEGEEKKRHCQQLVNEKLKNLLSVMDFAYDTIEAPEAIEKILHILFPDGNFQDHHGRLQYSSIDKAIHYCKKGQYDNALEELKKARFHAEEMTKITHRQTIKYTAPLFSLLEEEQPVTDSDETNVDDLIRCLTNNSCFDPLREKEEFKALLVK